MSPALQHTPVQGTSSKQISDTDMEIYIREEIDKIINLDQLYTVTAKFLEKTNIRTTFPYYLDAKEVLAIFRKDSVIAENFPNLTPQDTFFTEQTDFSIFKGIDSVVQALNYLLTFDLLNQNPEITWSILEKAASNRPLEEVIKTKVLKTQQRNYKIALTKFLVLFQSLKDLSTIFKENVALLTLFITTAQQINQHTTQKQLGDEGKEIGNLTMVLANTASTYNQNVEKLWEILTSFQPNARETLDKHRSIKSMDEAFIFYRKCCQTDCYTTFAYVGFAPIHKFQDLRAIRAEIRQIPSSTLNDPVKDPKDLLCEFNERGNISPITRNSRFKEKHFHQKKC